MEPTCWLDEEGRGFWFLHECDSDSGRWAAGAGFKLERLLPFGGVGWTLVQETPLTISPSIQCMSCNCHGFFRDGAWIPA